MRLRHLTDEVTDAKHLPDENEKIRFFVTRLQFLLKSAIMIAMLHISEQGGLL